MSSGVEADDLEMNPKARRAPTAEDLPLEHTTSQRGISNDNALPKGKSLSFKLAFIGLAASLFVFQLDATCLGIALPVSTCLRLPTGRSQKIYLTDLFRLLPASSMAQVWSHSGRV